MPSPDALKTLTLSHGERVPTLLLFTPSPSGRGGAKAFASAGVRAT